MKFILLNANDTNKNIIKTIQLDGNNYINELSFSRTQLELMERQPKGIIQNIKRIVKNRGVERQIFKALGGHNKKWHYILSNSLKPNKYLRNKTQELLGVELTTEKELDINIFKHINEYLSYENAIKEHEIKVLLVAKNNDNINMELVEKLINNYKTVSIYVGEKTSNYLLKRIKKINTTEGTTIDILNKERKMFTEYNVVYFMDSLREEYPRFRLNKKALIIDLSSEDKFNSNIIYMDEYLKRNDVNKHNVNELLKEYNKLQLARIIKKISIKLDK